MSAPAAPLAVTVVICAAGLAFARPFVALHLAMALIPLESLALPLAGASLTATEIMFIFTALGWILRRAAEGLSPFQSSRLGMPLSLLVLAILPGALTATHAGPVFKAAALWLVFLTLYQMVATEATEDTVKSLLTVVAISGAVVACLAIVQSHGGQGEAVTASGDVAGRPTGPFAQPNELAAFLVMSLPCAMALALGPWGRPRIIALVSALLIAAGLAVSLSRGGLLAATAVLLLMLAWSPARRLTLSLAVVVGGLFLIGLTPNDNPQQLNNVGERVASVGSATEGVDPRAQIWRTTPRIFLDHPLFGVGTDNYQFVSPNYGLIEPTTGEPIVHAHDFVLTLTAERGVLGLIAFVWLTVTLFHVCLDAVRNSIEGRRALVFGVTGACVGLMLKGLVDYDLGSGVIAGTFFVLAGCIVALERGGEVEKGSSSGGRRTGRLEAATQT